MLSVDICMLLSNPYNSLSEKFWPMCDFEKQGSHLIVTIKTGFCFEFVIKCIYSGVYSTIVYIMDTIILFPARESGPDL